VRAPADGGQLGIVADALVLRTGTEARTVTVGIDGRSALRKRFQGRDIGRPGSFATQNAARPEK